MTERIYSRYGTSFTNTLSLISDQINLELVPGVERIWVQGCNSGRSRLCFTVFTNTGYVMHFLEVRSFRQFRSDGNLEEEIVLMEKFINTLRNGILREYLQTDIQLSLF